MSETKAIIEPDDPVGQQIDELVMANPAARRAYFQQRVMSTLGRAIRAAREKEGLTQTQLAQSAGMTQAEISRIENALPVRGVTLATLVSLSDALNFRIAFEFEKLPKDVGILAIDETEASLASHLAVREMT